MNTKNLIICGNKAAGKSYYGRLLKNLGYTVYDTDVLLLETYNETNISSLFNKLGSKTFREKENQIIKELLNTKHSCIISTGGGFCSLPIFSELKEFNCNSIYLKQDIAILQKRAFTIGNPSYLKSLDPQNEFIQLCKNREEQYINNCDFVIELNALDDETAIKKILEIWRDK